MTAAVQTVLTSNGGSILTKNGYGIFVDPFRGIGAGRVRFQFDSPTYDPTTSPVGYKAGAHWEQVCKSPNIWDYWRNDTDWNYEFGHKTLSTYSRIQAPCSVLAANLEGITDVSYMFQLCTKVHDVYNFYAPDATNARCLFNSCTGMVSCEILSLESATAGYRTFYNCTSMTTAPLFTHSYTSAVEMFMNCSSLVNVPLYDTSGIARLDGMFRACSSLEHVPAFDTGSATSTAEMFYWCHALKDTPLFDTSNVTDMHNMFISCYALENVPLYDTSNVTNMSKMFNGCRSLEGVPLFNTASVVNFGDMLNGCSALKRIPLFDTSSCGSSGTCDYMCNDCSAVEDGAFELYQQWVGQAAGYPLRHSHTFLNCGANQQIPSSWGGLGA